MAHDWSSYIIAENGLIYVFVLFVWLRDEIKWKRLRDKTYSDCLIALERERDGPSPMIKTFPPIAAIVIEPLELLLYCDFAPLFIVAGSVIWSNSYHSSLLFRPWWKGMRKNIVSDQLILTNDGPMLTMEEVLYRRHGKRLKKKEKFLKKD